VALAEVDVRLRHRAGLRGRDAHVLEGQRPRRHVVLSVEVETQGARAAGQNRPGLGVLGADLLEPVQASEEFLGVGGASGEHDEHGE
jgi:hypothetical protein